MRQTQRKRSTAGQAMIIATATLMLIGAPPAPAAADLVRVPANKIQALMEGTSISRKSNSGYPMTWHFRPGGELFGELHKEFVTPTDTGKWWVSGKGRLCFKWEKWIGARLRCPGLAIENGKLQFLRRDGSPGLAPLKIKRTGPGAGPILAAAARGGADIERAQAPMTRQHRPGQEAVMKVPAVSIDKAPPVIEIPKTLETTTAVVRFNGRVRDSSQILEVTVDGRPLPVRPDGSFTVRRGVVRGKSSLVIAATDEWGNITTHRVSITRTTKNAARAAPAPGVAAVPSPARPVRKANPFAGLNFGAYHAVVIGNNDYRHIEKLNSARNDADTVAQTLVDEYGFRVIKLIDATRSQILGTLAKLRATLKPDDNLLIYYAGHGIVDSITEQGYWLPVDAEQQNPANWISNADLTSMLRGIRSRHVMVVADSCYSGTLVRAASAGLKTAHEKVKWVKRMLGKRGRTALVSGGLEPVVDSGTGSNHSVFAEAFIAALKENKDILEGQALFDRIKRPVVLNADQTPQYSDIRMAGHEGGEFMFVRREAQTR